MIVRLLKIDLHFPGRSSLKEKRFIMSSVKAKLAHRFNVAVAEVGDHEKWQRSLLAVVTVGTDGRITESTCQKVLKFLENDHRLEVLDYSQESR